MKNPYTFKKNPKSYIWFAFTNAMDNLFIWWENINGRQVP
jgi:hypothetical protein